MALSTLIVPVLLTFTACFALGKRVDVYSALTKGAKEGLTVLLHILPSLIALLSAVYMFRASGAMEALGALLAPALDKIGIPAETAPLLFIRPISGSGALAVGSEIMDSYGVDSYIGRAGRRDGADAAVRRRLCHRADSGGHARLERNDVLHRRRLLRCSGHYENALYYPRRALRRCGDVPRIRVFCAATHGRVKRSRRGQLLSLYSSVLTRMRRAHFPLCPPIVIA